MPSQRTSNALSALLRPASLHADTSSLHPSRTSSTSLYSCSSVAACLRVSPQSHSNFMQSFSVDCPGHAIKHPPRNGRVRIKMSSGAARTTAGCQQHTCMSVERLHSRRMPRSTPPHAIAPIAYQVEHCCVRLQLRRAALPCPSDSQTAMRRGTTATVLSFEQHHPQQPETVPASQTRRACHSQLTP